MLLSELGEKAFLRRVLSTLPTSPMLISGIGSDSAILDLGLPDDRVLVTKIDRAAQPTAAMHGWSDFAVWGRLALTTVASDILTSGGQPKAFMLSLILPGDFKADDAETIIRACAEACGEKGVVFAGGDTKEGPSPEVVGAGFGLASKGQTMSREGASAGDLIVVAGQLGGFLGAYSQMLMVDHRKPFPERWPQWLNYLTKPEACWREAEAVRIGGLVTASMDSSDGLYDAVYTLSGQHGATIFSNSLPMHPFALEAMSRLGVGPWGLAFGVGDWNIVFTIRRSDIGRLKSIALPSKLALTVIGKVGHRTGTIVARVDGERGARRLRPVVNEHFRNRQEDRENILEQLRCNPFVK